jgi:processive 1,2-diacylglycerol beta-glucosyltransferase
MPEASVRVVLCFSQEDALQADARRALTASLERLGASVRPLDLVESIGPASLRRVANFLGRVSERTLSGALARLGRSRFDAELQQSPPAVALALDAVAAQALLEWRRAGRFTAPIVGIDARLEPGAWAGLDLDVLAVADDVAAEQARREGIAERRLALTGLPVAPAIAAAAHEDRAALRARFGLAEDRPVVLVDARAVDQAAVTSLLLQLAAVTARVHLLFDVGADAEVAALLRRQAGVHNLRARMFGDVPEAPLYWRAADLCVIAAEPEPLGRCLALGVPPVVVAAPETDDVLALGREVEGRGGIFVAGLGRLGASIELAVREERLGRARAQAAARARPDGADEIAALALRLAAEKPAPAAANAAPDRGAAGALEEIGGADEPRAQTPQRAQARLQAIAVAVEQAQHRLEESRKELGRWEKRLQLAQGRAEATLQQAAQAEAESYRRAVAATQAELDRLAEERQDLEAVAAGRAPGTARPVPRAAALEADFRKLEIEDELAALKDRAGKDRKDK